MPLRAFSVIQEAISRGGSRRDNAEWSVVLVWLHIIRFSFSKKALKEQKFSLVLVSQLK